jgi:hypothetical protein
MELSDTEAPESIQPCTVAVADEVLTDLHERLRRRRMPEDPANEDWSYGTNRVYLDELLDYWVDVEAPCAMSSFLRDGIPGVSLDPSYFNMHYTNEWAKGGHFSPAEVPDSIVHDVRACFRPLRGSR